MKKAACLLLLLSLFWYVFERIDTISPSGHLPLPLRQVEAGDWVLRSGTSGDSYFIRYLSSSRFSHIGIVVESNQGRLLIAHAATDDDQRYPNQVLLSTWEEFAAVDKAEEVVVLRPLFLNIAQRQASADYARRQVGRAFILNAADEPHFYCSTLVDEAVRSTSPEFSPRWQYVDTALYRGNYLFPAAFAEEAVEWITLSPNQE